MTVNRIEQEVKNKITILALPANKFELNDLRKHPAYVQDEGSEKNAGIYNLVFNEEQILLQYNRIHNAFYVHFKDKDRYNYNIYNFLSAFLREINADSEYLEIPGPVMLAYHYAASFETFDFIFYYVREMIDLFSHADYNYIGSQTLLSFEKSGKPYNITYNISQPRSDVIIFEINFINHVNGKALLREIIEDLQLFSNRETERVMKKLEEVAAKLRNKAEKEVVAVPK